MAKQKILAISGAMHDNATSQLILKYLCNQTTNSYIQNFDISKLPFFDPGISSDDLSDIVREFHQKIEKADCLLICTPEYVFSLPGVLKNALEWLVATTLLENKQTGFIIAAASGNEAYKSLELILTTLQVMMKPASKLLLKGMKGKVLPGGLIHDEDLQNILKEYLKKLERLIEN